MDNCMFISRVKWIQLLALFHTCVAIMGDTPDEVRSMVIWYILHVHLQADDEGCFTAVVDAIIMPSSIPLSSFVKEVRRTLFSLYS